MTGPRPPSVPGKPAKLIWCALPDDGTDKRLLHALRSEKGVTRADSIYARGVAILTEAQGRKGKLPEPSLVRLVTVVVEAEEADELFDLIYDRANVGRPDGGTIAMATLAFATPYELPAGIPEEGQNPPG